VVGRGFVPAESRSRAGNSGPEEAETDGSAGGLGSVCFGAVSVHDGSRGHVRRPGDATQVVRQAAE
jgi:hypothetical protein